MRRLLNIKSGMGRYTECQNSKGLQIHEFYFKFFLDLSLWCVWDGAYCFLKDEHVIYLRAPENNTETNRPDSPGALDLSPSTMKNGSN